tara:strand:- start:20992 stop:22356 length:1365 start_codon:yes stop_codon:yes gene_type:complete
MHNTLITLLFILSLSTKAATIGLLDTGVDSLHPWLKNNLWRNYVERQNSRDDDLNGYIDDLDGWNFIKMDSSTFMENERGMFDNRFKKYYEVRAKRTLDQSSEQEDKWYKKIRKDDEFMERMKIFRRFIHGTHVAGVASGAAHNVNNRPDKEISILPVIYLGDAKSGPAVEPEFSPLKSGSRSEKVKHVINFIKTFSTWQKSKLKLAIKYVAPHVQIINGSFGTSPKTTFSKLEKWYEEQFPKEKIPEDFQQKYGIQFAHSLVEITEELCSEFPDLLMVFSAGNSKDDNDKLPHYPSNARCENAISVAAHDNENSLAYFSNFGTKTVDVMAPGYAIVSSVPDYGTFQVNGTSQAAPYVSNLAAKIYNNLPRNLRTPSIVKKIITHTANKSDLIKYGPINLSRALYVSKKVKSPKMLNYYITKSFDTYPSNLEYLSKKKHITKNEILSEELFSDL